METNPFDQFDAASSAPSPATVGNPFDQFDAPTPKPGLASRIATDLSKRATDSLSHLATGGILNAPAAAANVLFGGANDAIGETANAVTPQFIKDAVSNAAHNTANAIDNTSGGQTIGDTLLAAQTTATDLAKQYPEAAFKLKAIGNQAAFIPLSDTSLAAPISKTGKAITNAADDTAAARKASFVQDLTTPKLTPTVRAEQFTNATEEGVLRNRVVNPTPYHQQIIDTVSDLPVSKNNSLLKNYNIIADANTAEATDLKAKLASVTTPIPLGKINAALDTSLDTLKQNPFITGDAETSANRVIDGFKNILIKNNDLTPAGLLQARKDFDQWLESQKGAGVFDPERSSPVTVAVQNVRQTVNNLVANAVPDAQVKQSLAKQSNFYRAMDAIATKGGDEPSNLISRTAQKTLDLVPGKNIVQKGLATTAGLGTAVAAPTAAATALAGYGAYKAATSPKTWNAIGKTLSVAGDAADPALLPRASMLFSPSNPPTEPITPQAINPSQLSDPNPAPPLSPHDDLFNRVIKQESGGKQSAVSSKGAIGVAQIMPGTAKEAADAAGLPYDPFKLRTDANYNAALGKAYLDKMLTQYNGDPKLALMAYNWGPGNVNLWLKSGANPSRIPAETRKYVTKILGI